MRPKSAKHYGRLAQGQVQAIYDQLPEGERSWAAVAVSLGLDPKHKAAVNQVARLASAQRVVLEALGLPTDYTEVIACRCGCAEAAHCKAGRLLIRRDQAEAAPELALAGELVYEDMRGQRITVDLAQRAQRLGLAGSSVKAAVLYDLFCGRPLPPVFGDK